MKKTILIMLLCVSCVLSGCSVSNTESGIQTETGKFSESEMMGENQQLILLASMNSDLSKKIPGSGKAQDHGLYTREEFRKLYTDNKSMEISFGSHKQLNYMHSECAMKNNSTSELGEFYSVYDVYGSDEAEIKVLHNTDMICFYSKPYNPDDSYEVMDESKVKNIAETFLKSIMSEETLEKFTYNKMVTDALGRYAVSYVRYVEGYATDETLSVWIDRCGEVSGFNGYNLKKYDTLEASLKKEKIDQAMSSLQESIGDLNLSNAKCASPMIVTNTTGETYLQMYLSFEGDEEVEYSDAVLIKIE